MEGVIEGIRIIPLEELAREWKQMLALVQHNPNPVGPELQISGKIVPGSLVTPNDSLAMVLGDSGHHTIVSRQMHTGGDFLYAALAAAEKEQTIVRCIGLLSYNSTQVGMPVLCVGYHLELAERIYTVYHPKSDSTALQRT